jgi:hypothetical protein
MLKKEELAGTQKRQRTAAPDADQHLYVDRFGHKHSPKVLERWSPTLLRVMGIRPCSENDGAET